MEIFNGIIKGTDLPEAQEILKELDCDRDILLTTVYPEEKKIEVQFIQPINQVKTIGFVPDDIVEEIFEKYGENANVDISDYMVTYENGVYGLVADVEVDDMPDEDEKEDNKRLPLPLLIIVGALTGILTAVLIVVKLLKSLNDKK